MNLSDLERIHSSKGRTCVGAPLQDTHFLLVEGPSELVGTAFGEADFDISIEPGEKAEAWEQRFAQIIDARSESPRREATGKALFKRAPKDPTPENTVTVQVQRTKPGGTGYVLILPFGVPRGVSLLFALPPVCSASAVCFPASGDPDLFLMPTPFGPNLSASIAAGLAIDSVSFSLPICLPFTGFVPFFRVFGFLTSTGTLIFGGNAFP